MRIRRISLHNFGSHAGTELTFSDGINAIIGENGAGKTTILEAISYALYPRSVRNQESIIRTGSPGLKVELEFELNGHHYLIVREKEREGRSSALLYELLGNQRKLLQRDQSKVSKQVEALLGVGRETFLQAIYVRQGEIADLLEQAPAKRKELIGRLLGMEALEGIWEELKNAISRLDSKLYSIESEMKGIGDVFKEEASLLEELERLKEKKGILEKQEKELNSEIYSLKSEISSLDKLDKRYMSLKAKEENLSVSASQLAKEIESKRKELIRIEEVLVKLPDLEAIASKYEIISGVKEKITRIMRLRDRLNYLKKRKDELNSYEKRISSLSSLKKEREALEIKFRELSSLKDELIRLEEQLKILEEKASRIREHIIEERNMFRSSLAELSGLIGLELDESKDIDRIITGEIRSLETSINGLEFSLSSLKDEKSKLYERIEHNRRYLEDLNGDINKCPLCGSKLDKKSIERLRRRLLNEVESLKGKYDSTKEDIEVLASRISEMKSRLSKLKDFNLSEAHRSKEELESSAKELEKVEKEVNRISSLTKPLKDKLACLDELIQRVNEIRSKISKKEGLLPIIEEIKKELSEENIDSLRESLKNMEKKIRKDLLAIGLSEGSIDEEYNKSLTAFKEVQKLRGLLSTRDSIKGDLEKMKANFNGIDKEIRSIKDEISSLNYDPSRLYNLRKELERLEERFNNILAEKSKILGKIEELESRANQLRGKKEQLKELRAKRENLSNFRSKLAKIREVFSRDRGIQTLIREKARPSIERELNSIFSSFNFDYDSITLDDDFTPHLRRGKPTFSFDRLSGGERISLTLALRLAIARYLMASVETFVLDEPTIYLDEERINALIEAISSLDIPQMIIVTHSARFRDIATHSILVSKSGDVSRTEILDEEEHVSD